MHIHFVGCEGASMSRLRQIVQSEGAITSGSDIAISGHCKTNIEGSDVVVYTTACGEDNVEVVEARKRGKTVFERAEFLGRVSKQYKKTIAVAGTHGKTTTASILARIFSKQDATVHIGASEKQKQSKNREFFITEGCEYKRNFLHLSPYLAIVLNIELDHTDYFTSLDDCRLAFTEFLEKSETALVSGDDDFLYSLAQKRDYKTVGFSSRCDFVAVRKKDFLWIYHDNIPIFNAKLNLFGDYNILNAAAAASAAYILGISKAQIVSGLVSFSGVKRRQEYIGKLNGAKAYADFAHHPSAIEAIINAAKEQYNGEVVVVFEPHTYSRTLSLKKEFATSLALADFVYLMPVYPAREKPIKGGTSLDLLSSLKKNPIPVSYIKDYPSLFAALRKTPFAPNTVLLFLGAGTTIYNAVFRE